VGLPRHIRLVDAHDRVQCQHGVTGVSVPKWFTSEDRVVEGPHFAIPGGIGGIGCSRFRGVAAIPCGVGSNDGEGLCTIAFGSREDSFEDQASSRQGYFQ